MSTVSPSKSDGQGKDPGQGQGQEKIGAFEVFADRELAAGRPLIARLTGRKFDALLDGSSYQKPFDPHFGKAMVKTLSYLVTTLGATFGYAERTELSLFSVGNGGDARRLLSRIAGEASAKLSLLIGQVATFEARLYEFPQNIPAIDYFRWRQESSLMTAIDRYCGDVLGRSGADTSAVPQILEGLGFEEKLELLRQNAVDLQSLPAWHSRGATVRLAPTASTTGKLTIDLNPPIGEEFATLLRGTFSPAT